MAVSVYFNHVDYGRSQELIQDLVTESIQQRGIDVAYIKRDDFTPDFLFGESRATTTFENSITIEMMIKSYSGGGYNDVFMEKFGLSLDDTLFLQVSVERFIEEADVLGLEQPEIGDLIFLPYMNSVFEIKKCYFSDEDGLYQRGINYFHNLELTLYEPNLEADNFDTDIEDIDDDYNMSAHPEDETNEIDDEDSIAGIISDFDESNFSF